MSQVLDMWRYIGDIRKVSWRPSQQDISLTHLVLGGPAVDFAHIVQKLWDNRDSLAAIWIGWFGSSISDLSASERKARVYSIVFSPFLEQTLGISLDREIVGNLFEMSTEDIQGDIEHHAVIQSDSVNEVWSVRFMFKNAVALESAQIILGRIYAYLTVGLTRIKSVNQRVFSYIEDAGSPFLYSYIQTALTHPNLSGIVLSIPNTSHLFYTVYLPVESDLESLLTVAHKFLSKHPSVVKQCGVQAEPGYMVVEIELFVPPPREYLLNSLFRNFAEILES